MFNRSRGYRLKEKKLCLDFYCETLHEFYINIIKERHHGAGIYIMAYCMGGTLVLSYLDRWLEELLDEGKPMDLKKVVLMASPVKFDDRTSGNKSLRSLILVNYDSLLMKELFGEVNVPPQVTNPV
jgi:poly(3-hydroxyalkanoate) synthetase